MIGSLLDQLRYCRLYWHRYEFCLDRSRWSWLDWWQPRIHQSLTLFPQIAASYTGVLVSKAAGALKVLWWLLAVPVLRCSQGALTLLVGLVWRCSRGAVVGAGGGGGVLILARFFCECLVRLLFAAVASGACFATRPRCCFRGADHFDMVKVWWELPWVLVWGCRQGAVVGAGQGAAQSAAWCAQSAVVVAGGTCWAIQSECWLVCCYNLPCYLGSMLVYFFLAGNCNEGPLEFLLIPTRFFCP